MKAIINNVEEDIFIYHDFDTHTPKGGLTIAIKINNDSIEVGYARCNNKDFYCRKTGVKLAIANLAAKQYQYILLNAEQVVDLVQQNIWVYKAVMNINKETVFKLFYKKFLARTVFDSIVWG